MQGGTPIRREQRRIEGRLNVKQKVLAIDIGGSKMIATVAELSDESGELRYTMQDPIRAQLVNVRNIDQILEKIDELTDRLFQTTPLAEIDRIGIAIPGLTDERNWVFSSFSGIQNVPIVDLMEERFGKPTFIDNDVNGCALAEAMFGCGRDVDNFAWITISNGIGGGFIMDHKLYRGEFGFAAEFGHMVVEEESDFLCGCGNYGCFEAVCAGPAIARRYAAAVSADLRLSAKDHLPEERRLTAAEIAELARKGDSIAIHVFEREGELLGRAFAWVANILNPAKIVLGGGVAMSWDLFAPTMFDAFQRRIFKRANDRVKLEVTQLGYYAALIGAIALTVPGETPSSAWKTPAK